MCVTLSAVYCNDWLDTQKYLERCSSQTILAVMDDMLPRFVDAASFVEDYIYLLQGSLCVLSSTTVGAVFKAISAALGPTPHIVAL